MSQRNLGFSASRNQSPSRFTDKAITTSMAPGNTVIHQLPEKRNLLPNKSPKEVAFFIVITLEKGF